METQGQILYAYLNDRGSMFDFQVNFFIIDPANPFQQAAYAFDKVSTKSEIKLANKIDAMSRKQQNDRTQSFLGSFDKVQNGSKSFKFDRLTERGLASNVSASAALESFNSESFTVTVSNLKKKGHSIDIRFEGARPSWLPDSGDPFQGQLMLIEVKNFLDKKP